MPLHAYECCECERPFERLVTGERDTARTTCPKCQSTRVVRLLSVPAKPTKAKPAANCAGTGPPCGASYCGQLR